ETGVAFWPRRPGTSKWAAPQEDASRIQSLRVSFIAGGEWNLGLLLLYSWLLGLRLCRQLLNDVAFALSVLGSFQPKVNQRQGNVGLSELRPMLYQGFELLSCIVQPALIGID